MKNSCIVEVESLVKNYENVRALNNVNLRIFKGELFGLVGPDGAGKTTFLRVLCGVENKDEGVIKVFGLDADKHREEINKRIGYLSQKFSIYGDLTIEENIDFYAKIRGVKKLKVLKERLLELVRLTEFRKRLVDHLSGGMKQKTALACALIHSPELLILDEPTNGVDAVSRRDFWTILSELILNNITIIISTPYLDETERCNRVALMNKGKIITQGNPKELKATVRKNVYEIVCHPSREAAQIIKEYYSEIEVHLFGDKINVLTNSDIDLIIDLLLSNKIHVQFVRKIFPSMENVFIHLIQGEKT